MTLRVVAAFDELVLAIRPTQGSTGLACPGFTKTNNAFQRSCRHGRLDQFKNQNRPPARPVVSPIKIITGILSRAIWMVWR
jgi:hypothetical protein